MYYATIQLGLVNAHLALYHNKKKIDKAEMAMSDLLIRLKRGATTISFISNNYQYLCLVVKEKLRLYIYDKAKTDLIVTLENTPTELRALFYYFNEIGGTNEEKETV